MAEMYEKEYDLRTSDFDCFGNILPGSVLDIFQDIAGIHSRLLNVGIDDLKKKNLIWVLVKVKFELLNKPQMNSRVRVKTWPLLPRRATLRREYLISDSEGNVIIRGCSEWAVVHSELRRIMSTDGIYNLSKEDFSDKQAIEGKITKIHDFVPETEAFSVIPRFCDIDVNGHVNNTKYANFVMDALSPDGSEIGTFQIDYHKEVLKGDTLSIYIKKTSGEVSAFGKGVSGETMFSCYIKFK